jgi:FkbM family methyltransferase
LTRPEYFFQPKVAVRRVFHRSVPADGLYSQQNTPWQASIRYKTGEEIGRSLELMGIYDLSVSEVLWRLSDPGDFVCDIGANIGYTVSLLAARVGKQGKVICFEPHPEISEDLKANAHIWQEQLGWNQVDCRSIALSDHEGTAILHIPVGFDKNRGIATLSANNLESSEREQGATQDVTVQIDTLDNVLEVEKKSPTLLKVDVEGHEMSVFRGASKSLKDIRDVIYEEHDPHPAETTRLLQDQGFQIYQILKGFFGPVLLDPTSPLVEKMALYWEPANYLATKDSARAQQRMKKKGWACLHG